MICLGHDGDDKYAGILKLLDVLLSSEKEPEEKKKILYNDFDIKMTKSLESEVQDMCNLSKGIEEKGILVSIQNLMESMDWTAEQAMKALRIPETEQAMYANNLRK